jgi:uncharacterized membrane protein
VLDLHVPTMNSIHSEEELMRALAGLTPQIVTCLMSFLTLGIFWTGQQSQLNNLTHSDRHLSWIHMAFLCPVSLMPFSTQLLAQFIHYRTALLVYWLNIAVLGLLLYVSWRYAGRAGLYGERVTQELKCAMERRIVWGQAIYAVGAALCLVDTRLSIAVIVLAQLNFAIAPHIRWLNGF